LTHFTLRGQQVVLELDFLAWAAWFETADRHVDETHVHGIRVSTIFLSLDHNFSGKGDPILFETCIFGGPLHCTTWRYTTRAGAIRGHRRAVGLAGGRRRRALRPRLRGRGA
jgi:hypothetical protein